MDKQIPGQAGNDANSTHSSWPAPTGHLSTEARYGFVPGFFLPWIEGDIRIELLNL
jgi:hypothetical protein